MRPEKNEEVLARALVDKRITDGAYRLLACLCALHEAGEPFALSNKAAGQLCRITDKATIYARLKNLCPKYLKPLGVRGCPPTSWFELKGMENTTIKK
jgi:hypothetical protein